MDTREQIRDFLTRVRARQRLLLAFGAAGRACLGVAVVLLVGLAVSSWIGRSPMAMTALGLLGLAAAASAIAWALLPLGRRGRVPSRVLARFIEERVLSLEDRLATAIDYLEQEPSVRVAPVAELMLRDAAAAVEQVPPDAVVSTDAIRSAGLRAVGAALALAIVASFSFSAIREAYDSAVLVLVPSRLTLAVRPGDVRLRAGEPVVIEAQVSGTRAPVPVEVQIASGDGWRSIAMRALSSAVHQVVLEEVTTPFRYRVAAGNVISPAFAVSIARPPRVARIDLAYAYPRALGLKDRSEEDGGDIYAPAGTDVQVSVRADGPVASGRLTLGHGAPIDLHADDATALSGRLKVDEDNSYRVALSGTEGLASSGDTEYFIRVLADRPPDVHVTRPAGDRSVTSLQEVEIEAQADDDYGVERLELVYSIRGSEEQAVTLAVPRHATSVTARHVLYLEDLHVQPGDFVSYYVRARDLARGARSSETRSDIFFLDVRPFEQQFSLAQSQSMAGAGYAGALDELVDAQRQVVVATWKLDRRARTAGGARSESDIRAVARTETDLAQRAARTASSFRESTMRDPRRRLPGSDAQPEPARADEDAMAAAVGAMTRAAAALDRSMTEAALPPEMEALNHLLRAQADIKERQVAANQSAAGAAGNANRNFDLSTLFDEELRRQQQTSYEPAKPPDGRQQTTGALDAIRDLARRQDELLQRQRELARSALSGEERGRRLEQLTREQSELRQKVEDLVRQAPSSSRGERAPQDPRAALEAVSDDMRQAAADLRRGATGEASARADRARERLHELERKMGTAAPDERRRALGEIQLEARQLADRQRQIASELDKAGTSGSGADARRRLAGEQDRLTERAKNLLDRLKSIAAPATAERRGGDGVAGAARAFDEERPADLARALDRLADRLADAGATGDADTRRLSQQLARTERLRENLEKLGRALESLDQAGRSAADRAPRKAPGERGQTGEGRRGAGGTDLSMLREESLRQLRDVQSLVDELRREDPSLSRNGVGFTLEGQGLILSAPGTEAFKQDLAKWDALRRQAGLALERAQSSLSKKLQEHTSKDRLPVGVADAAPPAYQSQVEKYFKAIATQK